MKTLDRLKKYGSYNVHDYTSYVSFGCGAVKVNKSDLRTLAKMIENKEINSQHLVLLKHMNRSGNFSFNGNVTKFLTFAKLIKEVKITSSVRALNRIVIATGGRRTVTELLKMDPLTLRRLAGPVKVKS